MAGKVARIEGMKAALASFRSLDAHVQKQVGNLALDDAADVFIPEIQRRAQVSDRTRNKTPGSLRASVRKKNSRSTKGIARKELRADDIAAVPNEFGTSKMTPQPFFRPGVDARREEAAQAVADRVKREVETGPWVQGKE